MQDLTDESGQEEHIVVDGQQRIRAVLEFIQGEYKLEGSEVERRWQGLSFEDLSGDEKKDIFSYKFVVRILPAIQDEEIRRIFARINRNTVALSDQEIRNSTYWGEFIKTVQEIADEDPFWSESGIFTANDHRRMLDHEFISELVIAFLHGPQNKKDKLDQYYQIYETNFDLAEDVKRSFRATTGEIDQILPELKRTRWKKKSDFYTLFLSLVRRHNEFPWPSDRRIEIGRAIDEFGGQIDSVLRMEETERTNADDPAVNYARNVARAASDRSNRTARNDAFEAAIFATFR
jgi:hypothetical protein